MSRHLDSAQLEALLNGTVTEAVCGHLRGCAACQRALTLAAAAELELCLVGAHLDSQVEAPVPDTASEDWEEVSVVRQHTPAAPQAVSFGRRLRAAGGLGCCLVLSLWFNSAAAQSRTASGQNYAMAPCYRAQVWCN